MRIDAMNGQIVNSDEINLHDYIFIKLEFDYEKKKVCIILLSPDYKENTMIIYQNVLGLEIISSDFWGKSSHVLDWEIVYKKEKVLTEKITQEKKEHQYYDSRINENIDYIETILTTSSGDRVTISCEYIIVNTRKVE